jgi:hypothetical protein
MSVLQLKSAAFSIVAMFALGAFPAFAEDTKPEQGCAFTDRLSGWEAVDNSTAIVEMGVSHRYKVSFIGDCREMRDSLFAKVETRPGLCLSAGDRITFGNPHGIKDTCVIQSVEKLPPRGSTPASAPAPN